MDYCGCLGTSYYACLHVQKKIKNKSAKLADKA